MHTHGTAVLDRPAEATPAQTLPALAGDTWTRDQEPARSTDDDARELASRYDVHDLTYGELAVALNASGVDPKHFWSAEPAQLMAWAAQGLVLLGIERVWWHDYRTRRIHIHEAAGRDSADDRAEYARMWPNAKTAQRCHDAAYTISCSFGVPRRNMVEVELPYGELGCSLLVRVSARDLEFAVRYPHRTHTDSWLSALACAYTHTAHASPASPDHPYPSHPAQSTRPR